MLQLLSDLLALSGAILMGAPVFRDIATKRLARDIEKQESSPGDKTEPSPGDKKLSKIARIVLPAQDGKIGDRDELWFALGVLLLVLAFFLSSIESLMVVIAAAG